MKIILCDDCGFTVHEIENEEGDPYASDFIKEILAENAKLREVKENFHYRFHSETFREYFAAVKRKPPGYLES